MTRRRRPHRYGDGTVLFLFAVGFGALVALIGMQAWVF